MTAAPHRRAFLKTGLGVLAGLAGSAACSTPDLTARPAEREPHATENFLVHTNLGYAAPVGRSHLLDLYLPLAARGPVPVVIFQMGSAFRGDDTKGKALAEGDGASPTTGSMLSAPQLAALWVPHGYAVVGLNVRSSSQATFPAQVHDVKAAIRFLRAHAPTYGLDPHRFATMGNSSGGWIATMAALTSGIADLEGDLGNPAHSSSVRAAIDLFGPTDFLAMDAHRLPGGQVHDAPDSPESELMGFPIQTDPATVEKASPATYVTADSPPVFITHGTADPLVPANQSEILFDAYAAAGATATLALLPDVGHTDAYLSASDHSPRRVVKHTEGGTTITKSDPAPTFDALLAFLDMHLSAGGQGR
ncbi:alpha/beta hydrolase [Mycolicibacterium sp. BiH015]|uniref:alpha/beta hydrolase n=1 Tax=Mycolicibacterium sp. BiH015 TaxID=3018808 RepID=UPI0022E8779E|nr:alpha/beta hydrolase [Mycolicibacterium sp. BiH015]MDA2890655.1 alpha/beta hydrolase [Mycolicibacterium sp. BiH015]